MQISAKPLNNQTQTRIEKDFCLVLSELRKTSETEIFFRDFFTETERTVIAKRLAIALLLKQKKSYEAIKAALNVSSATISTVSEMLTKPGMKTALQKIEDEEWAENLIGKLPKFLTKKK